MHIKQIILSNFRSFQQQPEIKSFHPGTNCIVGRNGSGKSNLLDAIQFCLLSPRFHTLRTEERQALLFEGSGSAAVNAFVEIVFDNSDHRFALENSDEVVLRRTIGHKKDEFFLQRKRANKQEILSLLEGAGFSKSNPYYMVQQGKIHALCTMSDAERLRLLQQVAGTTVYEDKKAESLLQMQENEHNIDQIAEMLESIESRLEELHGEKEELTQYQKLDRQRRALEYCLYDQELRKAREMLDHLEQDRARHVEEAVAPWHEQARQTHDQIRKEEASLKRQTQTLRRNQGWIKTLEEEMKACVTRRTQSEWACQELQEAIGQAEELRKANRAELQNLRRQITQAQAELNETVSPQLDEAQQKLQSMTLERNQAGKQMDAMYAKQGRTQQFNTKRERDDYLRSHIRELQTTLQERQAALQQQQDTLANLRRSVTADSAKLQELKDDLVSKEATLQQLSQARDEQRKKRLEMQGTTRKDQWRKAEELQEKLREARDALHRALSEMRKTTPRATSLGLEALPRIVLEENFAQGEQFFGTLMDNMTLKDVKFQTAVEVAAQNSLFHVIVDTDNTAARLMERLEEGRLGRVTFLPLNRLHVEATVYPTGTTDVAPMLDVCVDFDPEVERAMQHVFNRKLLARTQEVASEWSSRVNMDAITLDGDLCSRKGALTGGYVDVTKSRLRAHAQWQEAQRTLQEVERDSRDATRKAQQVDQAVTNIIAEVQRLEAKQADMQRLVHDTEQSVQKLEQRLEQHQRQITKIEKTILPPLQVEIETIQTDIQRLRQEMGTDLVSDLTDEERANLQRLKQVHTDLGSQIETQTELVASLSVQRQKLQSLLEDNLLLRQRELTNVEPTTTGTSTARQEELEDKQRELDEAIRLQEEVETKLQEARTVEEELRGEMVASKNELERLKSVDMKNAKALEEAQDQTERLLNKRSMCVSKRELYMRKIQELGSLPPPSELESYTHMSISELMRQLESVNKNLKKYSHVNKKAYDQYVNFSEQRDSLLKRKEELDKGAVSVKELIESLDRQKDEAINRTFRGVSAHFKDVFQELVPNGSGELIMKMAMDDLEEEKREDSGESEESQESGSKKSKVVFDPNNPDVSLYRGVAIKVRFTAVGENFLMSQLSGGQKALVALALIFAIQRCDPAPFYIFDELDQALDSTYRAAVANVIQRQAHSVDNPTQFIVTTFRPELVSVADECFGISHQNKASSLHPLSKNDSLKFVANLMNEEEAVGDVTTLSTSRASLKPTRESSSRKRKASPARPEPAEESDEKQEEESSVDSGEVEPSSPP